MAPMVKCLRVMPILLASCVTPPEFGECRTVILRQQAAWNRGDLDAFCADYWNSEDLVFATASSTAVGWEAMRDRYRSRYTDRETMGQLAFSELSMSMLADDTVVCRGRWQLNRAKDAPWGRFVIVLRRFDDGWKVVADYTTSGS